jgi:hypothetical protein
MSRRFSDEPINLIRRIPTPEQLDAARPVKRSFGEKLAGRAASFVRSVVERSAQILSPRRAEATTESNAVTEEEPYQFQSEPVVPESEASDRAINAAEAKGPGFEEAAASTSGKWPADTSAAALSPVQPDEVAELRAYLLSQQQDIARLAAQIHELKSLVLSQQQVLVYLGKELESGPLSPLTGGVASAMAKRNRAVRHRPVMKEKAIAEKDDPQRPLLNR